MRLEEQLWSYTVENLKQLVRVLSGPGPEGTRKEFLVQYLIERLTDPASIKELWQQLDSLSQKATAAAFHNGGELDEVAFVAQYGVRPKRYNVLYGYGYRRDLSPLDLLLHHNELPQELMPLLEPLVPPPDRFQIEGLVEAPETLEIHDERFPLQMASTEQAGLHDLQAYLRLYGQGVLGHSGVSSRLTAPSVRTLLDNLLDGDFLPHEDRPKLANTIRPSGLDAFVRTSGLVHRRQDRRLSDTGEALLRHGDTEALLDAFESWAASGHFDELSRITAIKGQKAKRTRLTPPAQRREAIIEALSWCPAGVWIGVSDFYRAIKIWHFDIELDSSDYSDLYVEDAGSRGWALANALYINVVLWESLGSIGALDLLYLTPEYEDYYSLYDGLAYFRVNPLGAYLLGQAAEYVPSQPLDAPLFSIDQQRILTLKDPDALTPNLRHQLGQLAVEQDRGHYRLDTQQVLNALESGEDLQHMADFLARRNKGSLPAQASDWLQEIEGNTRAFRTDGTALLVKARSQALLRLVEEDPTLGKLAKVLEGRTLVIPSSKEKVFRERLKELGYLLAR